MICELFPFQKQAVNEMRLRVAMALNNYRMLKIPQVVSLQAPTGSGKTIIMSALIEDIFYGYGGVPMNLSLKHKLMLQSLSPLAFLTIVRNFKFTPVSELAENQSYWGEFVRLNNVLIVVFLLCATWILAAIISFISFTAFRWTDKKQGYQLSSFVEKEDASLNFFMTMIIPLLIDDVGTIQGAVTFLIIVVMMCALLSKTHLYYANPVLAILGYRVYEITFKSNPDFNNEICLAVVKGRFLKNPSTVEYKVINDTVLYMKEMNK